MEKVNKANRIIGKMGVGGRGEGMRVSKGGKNEYMPCFVQMIRRYFVNWKRI